MKITEEELGSLKAARNEAEWNQACLGIKAARGGVFPSDWWAVVMSSGLAESIVESWVIPGTTRVTVESVRDGNRELLASVSVSEGGSITGRGGATMELDDKGNVSFGFKG